MRLFGIALLLAAAARADPDRILAHEKGRIAGKQSMAASGHAISFRTPAGDWYIRSVLVCGSRYGVPAPFRLAICDTKLAPLSEVRPNTGVYRVGLFTWPEFAFEKPIVAPKRFKVVVDFSPTRQHGVYVCYSDVGKTHSKYGRAGGEERKFAKGKEWMIRVRLSRSSAPLGKARNLAAELAIKTVPDLPAGTLAETVSRLAKATEIPVVVDPALDTELKTEAVKGGLARDALGRLHAYDLRWGVVFVATKERLEKLPRGVPHAVRPAASVLIKTHLAARRVDLDFDGVPLETAVRHVADWLQFKVRWQAGVDRRTKITVHAQNLLGRNALGVLLLPRGLTYVVERDALLVQPR